MLAVVLLLLLFLLILLLFLHQAQWHRLAPPLSQRWGKFQEAWCRRCYHRAKIRDTLELGWRLQDHAQTTLELRQVPVMPELMPNAGNWQLLGSPNSVQRLVWQNLTASSIWVYQNPALTPRIEVCP